MTNLSMDPVMNDAAPAARTQRISTATVERGALAPAPVKIAARNLRSEAAAAPGEREAAALGLGGGLLVLATMMLPPPAPMVSMSIIGMRDGIP